MTPEQAEILSAALEAFEEWLIIVVWRANDKEARQEARQELIDAVDELVSALELDERRGGER
jgi:hypothetical protein